MIRFSGQHIPYNRELFVFLSGKEMRVPHRHGDVLVTHELLQFHERNFTRLRQPACERMPHGVQGDGVQTVAVFRCKIELSDGGLETGGCFLKSHLLARLLENRFRWLALVRLKHLDHVLRHTNEDPLASFLDDIEAAGVSVHILSAQFENFRGTQAGSQREQSHVVQLRVPFFKVIQKGSGFLSGQKTQPFIVSLDHRPCPALCGQWVDAAPCASGDSPVYGGTHEAEDIVDGLPGQSFARFCSGWGLDGVTLFELCISGGRFQELRLEVGKQVGGQLDNGEGVNLGLEVGAVLAIMLINVLAFASAPRKISVNDLSDGDFITFNGIDAGGLKLGKELCPLFSGRGRTDALAVPADGFPVAFAFVVSVPEGIDEIGLACAWITLGRLAEENALELGFDVFSASCALHEGRIASEIHFRKMLIQNLSKMDFRDKFFEDNLLNLLIIYLLLLAICDRERERRFTIRFD